MSATSVSSQARYFTFVFQENYMQTANLLLALFLTGLGALAACYARNGSASLVG